MPALNEDDTRVLPPKVQPADPIRQHPVTNTPSTPSRPLTSIPEPIRNPAQPVKTVSNANQDDFVSQRDVTKHNAAQAQALAQQKQERERRLRVLAQQAEQREEELRERQQQTILASAGQSGSGDGGAGGGVLPIDHSGNKSGKGGKQSTGVSTAVAVGPNGSAGLSDLDKARKFTFQIEKTQGKLANLSNKESAIRQQMAVATDPEQQVRLSMQLGNVQEQTAKASDRLKRKEERLSNVKNRMAANGTEGQLGQGLHAVAMGTDKNKNGNGPKSGGGGQTEGSGVAQQPQAVVFGSSGLSDAEKLKKYTSNVGKIEDDINDLTRRENQIRQQLAISSDPNEQQNLSMQLVGVQDKLARKGQRLENRSNMVERVENRMAGAGAGQQGQGAVFTGVAQAEAGGKGNGGGRGNGPRNGGGNGGGNGNNSGGNSLAQTQATLIANGSSGGRPQASALPGGGQFDTGGVRSPINIGGGNQGNGNGNGGGNGNRGNGNGNGDANNALAGVGGPDSGRPQVGNLNPGRGNGNQGNGNGNGGGDGNRAGQGGGGGGSGNGNGNNALAGAGLGNGGNGQGNGNGNGNGGGNSNGGGNGGGRAMGGPVGGGGNDSPSRPPSLVSLGNGGGGTGGRRNGR